MCVCCFVRCQFDDRHDFSSIIISYFNQCLIIYFVTCSMYRGQLLLVAESVVDCILFKIFASNLNFNPIPMGHFLHSSTSKAQRLVLIYLFFSLCCVLSLFCINSRFRPFGVVNINGLLPLFFYSLFFVPFS